MYVPCQLQGVYGDDVINLKRSLGTLYMHLIQTENTGLCAYVSAHVHCVCILFKGRILVCVCMCPLMYNAHSQKKKN